MQTEAKQISEAGARESLQAISRAGAATRRHGPNNGTVPLVWGVVVLACLIGYDLMPPIFAAAVNLTAAVAAAIWTASYRRHLPVKPLTLEKPWLFSAWGLYHAVVLMGGIALGTHFWHTDCARTGTFTLIGLLDSAPLLYVGWTQRRHARGEGTEEGTRL